MRIRSPRIAPPENGEDGSTAMTPTVRPRARATSASARTSVLLPLPGAPVTPTIWARPVWGYKLALSASARLPPASAHVRPRARALVEPSRIWLASVCTPEIMALPAILRHRRPRGAETSDLGDGRRGPAGRRPLRSTRQRQAELPAALSEGIAVEPEQPGGPQLIAARQLERTGQQGTLEELEGVSINAPRSRGRQLVDEWRNRIGDQARQRAESGHTFAAVMFFGHSAPRLFAHR